MPGNKWELICYQCMGKLEAPGSVCPHCGYDNRNRSSWANFLPATVLKDMYFVGRALGQGGFGVTYLGYDLNLERPVAIKEYFPTALAGRDSETIRMKPYTNFEDAFARGCQRALEEGRIIANMGLLQNVVQVYNAFQENGTVYIVMEYIKGATLAQMVKKGGPMKWEETYALLRPIMRALTSVHAKGVIHRDISPDNIILSMETGETVLLDFGAAHPYMEGQGGHTQSLRPGFAPVEQYSSKGVQDGRTDEYAMCATFYYMITGETPMGADQLLVSGKPLKTPRERGVDIPPAVEAVLMKGMSLRMESRYASMSDLMHAFDAAMAAEESGEQTTKTEVWTPEVDAQSGPGDPPAPPAPEPPKKKRRNPVITILMVVLIAFGALIGYSVYLDSGEGSDSIGADAPTVSAITTVAPVVQFSGVSLDPPAGGSRSLTNAPTLMEDSELSENKRAFGGVYLIDQIVTITFKDTLRSMPSNAWDVSANGDGSVMAWAVANGDLYDLTIAGDGGVRAPQNCERLFADYDSLVAIHFNGCFDTSGVTTMNAMFAWSGNLQEVDVGGFDTSNVTDMGWMFACNFAMRSLDLSSFDTRSVQSMQEMFRFDRNLTEIRVGENFVVGADTETNAMFEDCPVQSLGGYSAESNAYVELRRGDRGDLVRQLQMRLVERNYIYDVADGSYGAKTEAAVKLVQQDAGLPQTGVADAATQAALSGLSHDFEAQSDRQLLIYAAEYDADAGMMCLYIKNTGRTAVGKFTVDYNECNASKTPIADTFGNRDHTSSTSWTYDLNPGGSEVFYITEFYEGAAKEMSSGVVYAITFLNDCKYMRFSVSEITTGDGMAYTPDARYIFLEMGT